MCILVLRYLLENGLYVGEGYYSKKSYDRTSLHSKYPSLYRVSPQKKYSENFFDYLPYKYMSAQKLLHIPNL